MGRVSAGAGRRVLGSQGNVDLELLQSMFTVKVKKKGANPDLNPKKQKGSATLLTQARAQNIGIVCRQCPCSVPQLRRARDVDAGGGSEEQDANALRPAPLQSKRVIRSSARETAL